MSEFDDLFNQINKNNQTRQELKNAVHYANFDSIAEIIWRAAAHFLGERVSVLKNRPWLCWIIEELTPAVYHFLKENWTVFFPY